MDGARQDRRPARRVPHRGCVAQGRRPAGPADRRRTSSDLVDCLAGAAIPQQDLLADLAEREAACDLLTRDQADVLDMLARTSRVEIRGGAGSGKTWLAVEKARRLTAEGKRVALMCYSRGLAEFLDRRVGTLPPPASARPTSARSTTSASAGASRRARTTTARTGRSSSRPGWSSLAAGAAGGGTVRRDRHRRGAGLRRELVVRRPRLPARPRDTAASTSSPTRASASSPARAGRPST